MFELYFLKLALPHVFVRFIGEPQLRHPKAPVGRDVLFSALYALGVCVTLFTELRVELVPTIAAVAIATGVLERLRRGSTRNAWAAFVAAQLGHLLVFAVAALWWSLQGEPDALAAALKRAVDDRRIYWVLLVYVSAVFGGGVLVQTIGATFSRIDKELATDKPGLKEAGRFIGWLERALIITLVVGGLSEAIGFLLGAKAVARYPELDKKGVFAEYFLVGTLTSVGIAVLAGLILRRALHL